MTAAELETHARRRLRHWVARAWARADLRRRNDGPWRVEVRLLGAPAMRSLNRRYRRRDYATDVLSFSAHKIFRAQGILGELVLCAPVLRRQAREQGHSEARELDVLLVHGLLHLLDFDHERGVRAASDQARAEARLLGPGRAKGLIARLRSGKS